MTDAVWKNMADWSDLPDVYVTKAECQQGMFWRIEACSVPMAIGPEVRLIREDRVAALIREAEAERDEAQRLMQMRHREMLAADELMRKHQGRAVAAEADRDRLAAANAVLEAKVAGLDEHRASAMLRRDMNAPEDPHVEALCERYGYGAVMDAASRLWARKDSMGAFYIGGCIGMKTDREARAALATQEAGTC